MSNETKPSEPQKFVAETQHERWMKYGANVALSMIVVVLLAILVTYLAQRFAKRIDTTEAGIYSLKPQTVNLIKDNKQKLKLVSLFAAKNERDEPNPYAGPVRDLLEEYSRKGKNIDYEVIDPVKEPTKTDVLVSEAIEKYGGSVQAYRDFFGDFTKTSEQLKEMANMEGGAVADIQTEGIKNEDVGLMIDAIKEGIPQSVARLKERIDRTLKGKYPDYKALADSVKDSLESLSRTEGQIVKFANQFKDEADLPAPVKEYLAKSPERHEAMKKILDDTSKKIDTLGELKIGELQNAIKSEDMVLVMGEKDWRVINPGQLWITDTSDIRNFTEGKEIKPRFAGEQAVTTAILALNSATKPKVAFLRPGGSPLTTPGMPPFQRGGPFSGIGERLRDYNFDVVEKDLSGQYAIQAQMQGMPAGPEPSDEEIKDAVWIMLNVPGQSGPSPVVAKKLADHLKDGGAAMVISLPESDNLSDALKDYGVEMLTDTTIVHEAISQERARSGDFAEEVQRDPVVFVLNKYGDHMLTAPVRSLDFVVARGVPVRTLPTSGVTQTSILPIPSNLKTWGERDSASIGDDKLKYDEAGITPDLPPPLYAGAVVEKGKTRLVVIGDLIGFTNQVLSLPDSDMLRRGVFVSRFPGNEELFTNAVFWLAKMEPMIAISPAAMQVSRISDMGDTALGFWRIGVLLILLPGLVVAAGIMMYFARRD